LTVQVSPNPVRVRWPAGFPISTLRICVLGTTFLRVCLQSVPVFDHSRNESSGTRGPIARAVSRDSVGANREESRLRVGAAPRVLSNGIRTTALEGARCEHSGKPAEFTGVELFCRRQEKEEQVYGDDLCRFQGDEDRFRSSATFHSFAGHTLQLSLT